MRHRPPRVMWLLNHSSARNFEIPMMKSIGISEFFLPKVIPADHNFRSASIDYSEDSNLTIPSDDLAILNAADWYGGPGIDAWRAANKHFDIAFFILHRMEMLASVARNFEGACVWRTYGLDASLSYSGILNAADQGKGWYEIRRMGRRFWFGKAYDHLDRTESSILQERSVYLPLGMSNAATVAKWTGQRSQMLFICPEIASSPYYGKVYDEFLKAFSEFDFVVGGAQPVAVDDKRVLGFIPSAQHLSNMTELRVMFYHSTEPNHLHYHPIEAIRAGMPLVFMAGGMLDRFGGEQLPGRCTSISEAKEKVRRILDNDQTLIEDIRSTQILLLETFDPDKCRPAWRKNFKAILHQLEHLRIERPLRGETKRVAIILPWSDRNGAFRLSKRVAEYLRQASEAANEMAEIVFGYLNSPDYRDTDFDDLPRSISRRSFRWTRLDADQARRAMYYAGFHAWQPTAGEYLSPDDGMQQFTDCDLCIIVSDRLSAPLLPVTPYIALLHDYSRRRSLRSSSLPENAYLAAARSASQVLVMSKTAESDALNYGGIDPKRLSRVSYPSPVTPSQTPPLIRATKPYFLWNMDSPSEESSTVFEAFRIYWQQLEGCLNCHLVGPNTLALFQRESQLSKLLANAGHDEQRDLRARTFLMGEISQVRFRAEIGGARFLLQTADLNENAYNAVEAAQFGNPTLSKDHPMMRDLQEQFGLTVSWVNPDDPEDLAQALKEMELHTKEGREELAARFLQSCDHQTAAQYWNAVRECL